MFTLFINVVGGSRLLRLVPLRPPPRLCHIYTCRFAACYCYTSATPTHSTFVFPLLPHVLLRSPAFIVPSQYVFALQAALCCVLLLLSLCYASSLSIAYTCNTLRNCCCLPLPIFCFSFSFSTPFTLSPCYTCLLYTSPSPRDGLLSRMPSSA